MPNAPFRPILDRLAIRRIEPEAATDGFQVPEKYRQHTNEGIVVSLGHGVVLGDQWRPLTDFVQVGDRVMYGEYNAERWESGDDVLWIVRVQDIRGVVTGTKEINFKNGGTVQFGTDSSGEKFTGQPNHNLAMESSDDENV